MFIVLVTAKVSSGYGAELCKELDVEPEHYEIHEKHPTGTLKIKNKADNLVDALVLFNQLVEELVMTKYPKIIYTPPGNSNYTGLLSGIYYVDGNPVTEEQFRKAVVEHALKRAEEIKGK